MYSCWFIFTALQKFKNVLSSHSIQEPGTSWVWPTGCLPTHALHVYPLPAASLCQQRALENIKRPQWEGTWSLLFYSPFLPSLNYSFFVVVLFTVFCFCLIFRVLFFVVFSPGSGSWFQFWLFFFAPQKPATLCSIGDSRTQASACSSQVWVPALQASSFLVLITPLLFSVTSGPRDGSSFL